jgi:hypothetical protein
VSSVTQDWVQQLPWKMQSVLMTATRGPDEARHPGVKVLNRWIRGQLFHDADPANPFIKNGDDPIDLVSDEFLSGVEHELEYLAVHYFGHLIHALEIIGYTHPDCDVQEIGMGVYRELCLRILHLPVEGYSVFASRLMDVTIHE